MMEKRLQHNRQITVLRTGGGNFEVRLAEPEESDSQITFLPAVISLTYAEAHVLQAFLQQMAAAHSSVVLMKGQPRNAE